MCKYRIVRSSKIYDYEQAIENLRKENSELRDAISALKEQIHKMERGERACGNHCEGCKHAYVKREVFYTWGPSDRTYGCKLDSQAACPDFEAKG